MRFPAFCAVLVLALAGVAHAATNAAPGLQPERWLLVVDTSSPMKNRAPATHAAVAGLLDSAMNGQLQEGHELGLWTFADELHTDLDVMKWLDWRTNAMKRRFMDHLAVQKYEGRTEFKEVLDNLKTVVKDSRRLTVILFSDGDEVFEGTPHDAAIAAFFKANREEARSGKVPIVTVLRGARGEWAGLAQSYPPWPVTFPAFPPEPEPVLKSPPAATAPINPPPATKRPVIVAEPLVVRGPDPLSKEIEEKGLATNTAAGNIVIQKPPLQPQPPEPATNNEPGLADVSAASEPEWPKPVPESPGPAPDARPLRWMVGAAAGLLALVAVTALVMRRRMSGRRHTSVITRSMNGGQDKPPSGGA